MKNYKQSGKIAERMEHEAREYRESDDPNRVIREMRERRRKND